MGSSSKSSGSSRQQSQATSTGVAGTFVDPAQAGYLDQIRAEGFSTFESLRPGFKQLLEQSQAGIAQGQGFLNSLTQPSEAFRASQALVAGGGEVPQARSSLLDSSASEGVIEQLGIDINRQLGRQMGGAGGINTDAALAGGLGGGRNQVERGLAQEGAIESFARGAGTIRREDLANRQQLDVQQGIANLNASIQDRGQRIQGGVQGEALRQQGAATGLEGLGSLFNLGLGGLGAQFAGLSSLSGILGDPTLLSRQFNTSQQTSRGRSKQKANELEIFQFT